jgi:hypothetical protein
MKMPLDFTVSIYKKLLTQLIQAGYAFQTVKEFVQKPAQKTIMLRHDVDARNKHSLLFAKIQHKMGIVGTYYFRMVPESFDEKIIQEIAEMGHEIGYHYEDMDFAKGDVDEAYKLAKKHLEQLRELADVKTICMHGSPRSPYDNKAVWQKYDYRELGIIAEPYFDLDFSEVLYLTDTGRRWDGGKFSIRDKEPEVKRQNAKAKNTPQSEFKRKKMQRSKLLNYPTYKPLSKDYSFHSTQDIINASKNGNLPNKIMFNFHPQRWTDNPVLWTQELVWQNVKNLVKWGVLRVGLLRQACSTKFTSNEAHVQRSSRPTKLASNEALCVVGLCVVGLFVVGLCVIGLCVVGLE